MGTLLDAIVLGIVLLTCKSLDAQMDAATVTGYVVDFSARSIPEAMIELLDVEHGSKIRTVTNRSGLYVFPHVAPGRYRITVKASGYRTIQLASLSVSTQDELQQNFRMELGLSAQPITLAGGGAPIEKSGAVGTLVDKTLVAELPLNGRSFQTLFQLTPGIVITPTTFASQGQFSVNGQRTNTNYFIVDGVSANFGIAAGVNPGQSSGGSLPALTAFGGTNSLVSTVDVQEFAVLTSGYSAEFGRMPGAQVSIVTKTGTSELHGELFDYVRNGIFDANDWFANRDGLRPAALQQNDFGGAVGGPVIKNKKTFFFGTYEGLRLLQPTSRETDVPTLFARETAPPPVKPILDAYPLPTGPEKGNGLAGATYAFSDPSTLDSVSVRADHHHHESISFFVRYAAAVSEQKERGASINSLSTVTQTRFGLKTLTTGLTIFKSPRFVDTVRVNWSVASALSRDNVDTFHGAIPPLDGAVFPSGIDQSTGLFQVLSVLGSQTLRLSLGKNVGNRETQSDLVNTAFVNIKSHGLKFGIDVRRMSSDVVPSQYAQATLFNSIASALNDHTLATVISASVPVHSVFMNISIYAQDQWSPRANVRITYGLRWEYNPAPQGRGANGSKPFAVQNFGNLKSLSFGSPDRPIYTMTANNFAPRVALAYGLNKSVVQVGAGMFYDTGNGPAGTAFSPTSFPFSADEILFGLPFSLLRNTPPPAITLLPPFRTLVAFPPTLRMPYTWQWHVGLQQTLGIKQTATISFVSAAGHSLLRAEQYVGGFAGVPDTFTQILFTSNAGYSNYNSLQILFERRHSSTLSIVGSYTLSHSLDNVSTDTMLNAIPIRFTNVRADYGASDFDIRHTATFGLDYVRRRHTSAAGLLATLFADWGFDPILMVRSSPPVDVVLVRRVGVDAFNYRPDLVANTAMYIDDQKAPGGRRINSLALSVPALQTQGNLGRNAFRGFPFFQIDCAVRRTFDLAHRIHLDVRAEGFNLLNHPNFSSPESQLGIVDPNGLFIPRAGFGISSTTLSHGLQAGSLGSGFSPLYQIGSARSLQLALRLAF